MQIVVETYATASPEGSGVVPGDRRTRLTRYWPPRTQESPRRRLDPLYWTGSSRGLRPRPRSIPDAALTKHQLGDAAVAHVCTAVEVLAHCGHSGDVLADIVAHYRDRHGERCWRGQFWQSQLRTAALRYRHPRFNGRSPCEADPRVSPLLPVRWSQINRLGNESGPGASFALNGESSQGETTMQNRIVARLRNASALAAFGAVSLALGVAGTASAKDAPEPPPDANGNKACAVYAYNPETEKTEIYEWIDHGGVRTAKSGSRMRCDNGKWKPVALDPASTGTTGGTSGTYDGAFTGTTRTTGSTSGTYQP